MKPKQPVLKLLRPFVTAVLIFASLAATPVNAAEQRFMMTTSVGAPLYFADGNGLYNLMVTEIFRRLRREYELIWLPSQRSLSYTNGGVYDGNIARTSAIEKRNRDLIKVPEPVFVFEFMAYSREPGIEISDWNSLNPYVVGIINGWKIVEANVADAKQVTSVNDYEQLFKLLDKGRIDIAVLDRVMGGWKLQGLGLDVSILEPPIIAQPMYIYLHKRHADLAPEMARVIREMKNDGSFAGIYAKARVPLVAE